MTDYALGFAGVATAVIFFGSYLIPVKKFETGDGMFFQFVQCCGIWVFGLFVNLIIGSTEFVPLAMLGGAIWTTGNLLCIPIINRIGMALGLLVWGGAGMTMGWASGVFGFFGINKSDDVESWPLNIAGICMALVSMLISTQVRPVDMENQKRAAASDRRILSDASASVQESLLDADSMKQWPPTDPLLDGSDDEERQRQQPPQQQTLRRFAEGLLMSLVAGSCFGLNFVPPQYVIDNEEGASQEQLDYVFSHFTGVFVASTIYFVLYCAYKQYWEKTTPPVYPKVIVGAFVSGLGWAIAQTGFFVANGELSFVTSFPIISVGPGIVGSIYGVFLYKEIRGTRNFVALAGVFFCFALSSALIVLSRL